MTTQHDGNRLQREASRCVDADSVGLIQVQAFGIVAQQENRFSAEAVRRPTEYVEEIRVAQLGYAYLYLDMRAAIGDDWFHLHHP